MIDFHNHILPDTDDGPKTIKESIEMLQCAYEQGITDIIQTVHFQHPKMDGKNVDYDYLTRKVVKLQNEAYKKKINVKIYLSAEVFYLPNLVQISKNPLVTIGNGKYMLIEFLSNIYPTGYEDEFFKLQSHNITPIVAHPERYRFIQKDINILKLWIERGYIIQIDSGSILGQFGQNILEISTEMINKNYIHLIGSDAHNTNKRNFNLLDAYKKLLKLKDENFVNQLKENSYNILNGLVVNDITNYVENVQKNISTRIKHKISKLLPIKKLFSEK